MHTMKLRPIGINHPGYLTGVVLTPEEYEKHPAYHPFISISSTYLFAWNGERWNAIDRRESSRYALLEASDDERKQLKEAGYRMLNL
jgi:hypothetical protein